ncbi:hypothetical protein P8610_04280 [Fictibacillus sp. UD]|uniref:hypothetical protein n=1 Tax=Fictibacillus sp. UD TaxID=3038777 RepID=UPI003745E6E6
MIQRWTGYTLLVIVLFPFLLPALVRSYLPEQTHFVILFSLNILTLSIVIYLFKYAYKRKNAAIVTMCLFLLLQLFVVTINLIIGS